MSESDLTHCFISSHLFTFHPGEIQTCFSQSFRNTAALWRVARPLGAPIRLLAVCSSLVKRVRELSRVESRLKIGEAWCRITSSAFSP